MAQLPSPHRGGIHVIVFETSTLDSPGDGDGAAAAAAAYESRDVLSPPPSGSIGSLPRPDPQGESGVREGETRTRPGLAANRGQELGLGPCRARDSCRAAV